MTIFGWDASHYDGTLTTTILAKAKAEGIVFFSHKLGEAISVGDSTQGTALAAARDAGITLIGGYWFIHGNVDAVASARACIAMADAHEPWWRDFPGWYWQTDAETSPTGLPSPAYTKTFSDALAAESGRTVIVYASHGMYGDRLDGLGHRLWNANYPSSRHAPFKDLYPGDSFSGWAPYSGQTPTLCQYTSSATIAGLTTCDANAFRGTLAELTAIIEGDEVTKDDIAAIVTALKPVIAEQVETALSDPATAAALLNNLLNGKSADQQRAVSATGLANADFAGDPTAKPPVAGNTENQLGYTLNDIQTRVRSICAHLGLPAHD